MECTFQNYVQFTFNIIITLQKIINFLISLFEKAILSQNTCCDISKFSLSQTFFFFLIWQPPRNNIH